jgi:hypothetical protein
LVLHAGQVVEAGTHTELLALKGRYAQMWKKQIRAERAAEAASQMVAKANKLREAAMETPNSGNDISAEVSDNEADTRSTQTLVTSSLASRALVHAAESYRDSNSSSGGVNDDSSDDRRSDEDKQEDESAMDINTHDSHHDDTVTTSSSQTVRP